VTSANILRAAFSETLCIHVKSRLLCPSRLEKDSSQKGFITPKQVSGSSFPQVGNSIFLLQNTKILQTGLVRQNESARQGRFGADVKRQVGISS
jgi:hypothetical protein